MSSGPVYVPPNIENYRFRPQPDGTGICQLGFRFNREAAPETHIRALVVRMPDAEGHFFYKLGIVNPHVQPRDGGKLTDYFYEPAEAKMMLNLPPDTMETDDGYIGPFDAQTMSKLMVEMQGLAMRMHLGREAKNGGAAMPGMPRFN